MSFLGSVIADARPRKPMLEPSNGPSAITGWKTRGLDGDAFGAAENAPGEPDRTSRLSTSLPIREGAGDFNMGDSPASQADNSANQGIQDTGSNVETDSPMSVSVDKSGPIPAEESSIYLDADKLLGRGSDSEGGKSSATERDMTQQPAGTIIPDSRMNSPKGQGLDPSVASPERRGAQNRASGHEETEPVSSPASVMIMPGKELTDNDGNSPLQAEKGTGQLGVVETMSSAAEGNTPVQGEVAEAIVADDRRHSERSIRDPETLTSQADLTQTTALTSPGSSRRIESCVLNASLIPSSPSPDASGNPTLDTAAAAKGVLRDVQLVSGRAMDRDSHISSDIELAAVAQLAGKTVSASASSAGSGSSKPGSHLPHIARPAKPLASPEALRSVPARPFQEDLMPKDGDSFHSKAPLRSPEKKHEVPKVEIGQIDVIIEAAAQSAPKPVPAPAPIDMASRHYLRRL